VHDDRKFLAEPPPTVNVVRAMVWNWWVVLVAVLVFAFIGAVVAIVRTPTYTATAKLAVGRIDINSPGALSGYAVATQALATGYSRTITAQAVVKPAAAQTDMSVSEAENSLTATPVAESPVFRVDATSVSKSTAIDLANASSHALVRYAARLNQDNPDSARLYRQYRTATVLRKIAEQELHSATEAASSEPTGTALADVAQAQSSADAADLRANALGKAYTASVQGQAATQLIQILSPATDATSDRRSVLMILVFVGAVLGLLIGGVLATWRESRLNRDESQPADAAAPA
jgi:capsular polysaccharide biosynthesis protein